MDKEERFYDLLAYIAASAKEMYIDPKIYAPLRLLSVMLRLLEMYMDEEGADRDFLKEMQQMVLDRLILKIAARNFS
jgi:hypothetical protein